MSKKASAKKSRPNRFFKKRYLFLSLVLLFVWYVWKELRPPEWWQFSLPEQISQQPLLHRQDIVLSTNHGSVIGLNQRTGKVEWEFQREKDIATQTEKRGQLLVAYNDGVIVALELESGKSLWQYQIPESRSLATGLLTTETKLIFGDTGGRVYGVSLQSGHEDWTTNTPNPESVDQVLTAYGLTWFGSLIMDRNMIYVVRTHGYVAELHPEDGKIGWEMKLGSKVLAEPLITRTKLFVSTQNSQLSEIDRQSGKLGTTLPAQSESGVFCQLDSTQDGAVTTVKDKLFQKVSLDLLTHEHEQNQEIVQVSQTGKVQGFDTNSLQEVWQLDLGSAPKQCFFDQASSVYVSLANGKLDKVSLRDRRISWQVQTSAPTLSINSIQKPIFIQTDDSKKYYYTNYLFVATQQQSLQRLNPATGETLWTFKTEGSPNVQLALKNNQLFVVSANGGLYRIDVNSGKPNQSAFFAPRLTWSENTPVVKDAQIYELTLHSPSDKYFNPYTAVNVSAEFSDDSGNKIPVNGFYYDKDEWRVRFNPPTLGKWTWKVRWEDPFQTKELSGEFVSDRNFSFLHPDPKSPKWLTRDNETIQPLVGLNDCFLDSNQNGSPLDDFFIKDGSLKTATLSGAVSQKLTFNTQLTPLSSYLDTYRPGFNLFRENVGNCSPLLYLPESFLYSRFLSPEGKYYDEISRQLYEKKYSIWFTLFGFSMPFGQSLTYTDEGFAVENYIKYAVARYGAYVDIWEISNEAVTSDAYVKTVADLIQKYDPYHRLISVSWEKPELKEISLIAPHWYQSEPDKESDLATLGQLAKFSKYSKPIIFGEQGNQLKNWDKTSAQRMRVRIWTAFFHQASLAFWNQSDQKDHYNPTFQNSNIYLGDEERKYSEVFLQLMQGLPTDLVPDKELSVNGTTRSYTLRNKSMVLRYFFNSETNVRVRAEMTNSLEKRAKVEWFNSQTGELIQSTEVAPNATSRSPVFNTDILVKVTAF